MVAQQPSQAWVLILQIRWAIRSVPAWFYLITHEDRT